MCVCERKCWWRAADALSQKSTLAKRTNTTQTQRRRRRSSTTAAPHRTHEPHHTHTDTHLVEPRREQVARREDAAVGPEAVLLHDVLVVDGVPDVDVGAVWQLRDRGVEVYDVARAPRRVEVAVEALDERRLAGAGHACADIVGWCWLITY